MLFFPSQPLHKIMCSTSVYQVKLLLSQSSASSYVSHELLDRLTRRQRWKRGSSWKRPAEGFLRSHFCHSASHSTRVALCLFCRSFHGLWGNKRGKGDFATLKFFENYYCNVKTCLPNKRLSYTKAS